MDSCSTKSTICPLSYRSLAAKGSQSLEGGIFPAGLPAGNDVSQSVFFTQFKFRSFTLWFTLHRLVVDVAAVVVFAATAAFYLPWYVFEI